MLQVVGRIWVILFSLYRRKYTWQWHNFQASWDMPAATGQTERYKNASTYNDLNLSGIINTNLHTHTVTYRFLKRGEQVEKYWKIYMKEKQE